MVSAVFNGGFQGFMPSGRLVLLQWCACRFLCIWGHFSVVQNIHLGGQFCFFWLVLRCMMLVGPALPFAPGPGGLGFWAFCLGDFRWLCVGLQGNAGVSPSQVGAHRSFSLDWGTATSQVLYFFNNLLFLDFRPSASKHMLYVIQRGQTMGDSLSPFKNLDLACSSLPF